MKIAIIGVGAMGSVYAAFFAEAGHEVWAIDTWKAHIDAIRSGGLRIEGASGDRTLTSIKAAGDVQPIGRCDLFVIATKLAGVEAAAASIAPLLAGAASVVAIQNGLGSKERVLRHLPRKRIVLGVAEGFGASVVQPGHVHHSAMNLIRFGEVSGRMTERLKEMVELWRTVGFRAREYDDIDQLIWEKLVCNVAFSAPCTVFNRTLGQLMRDPDTWCIAEGCAREAVAVGRRMGVSFTFECPDQYVAAFGNRMPDARPSMLLDHDAGRLSEIEALNGMVSALGREHGVPTPYNDVVSAVVRDRESNLVAAADRSAAFAANPHAGRDGMEPQ